MLNLLIIAQESKTLEELHTSLVKNGFACLTAPFSQEVMERVTRQSPDLVLVEVDGSLLTPRIWEFCQRINQEKQLPIIVLTTREMLDNDDGHLEMTDDFVVRPYDLRELELRIKRLTQKGGSTEGGEVIRCDDLLIDVAKCEVSIGNRQVLLAFREFELLKFLSSNRGRVFTRQDLLNKVWGYDYYGGDRTVDVHIRRLRSKIEDSTHTFIDTVRNIGYRFRKDI